VRTATSTGVTTGIALGIIAGTGIVVGIASRHYHHPPQEPPRIDVSPAADLEIEPSSSTAIHEPPPPPEGPFYASLFVAGATWTLPCRYDSRWSRDGVPPDEKPSGMQRCRVESVEVTPQAAAARIACWYVHEGATPDPAVNMYVMTPKGLYKAAAAPSTRREPMFAPHPVAKSLPKRWGYEEPKEATWAHAIVRHHDAWCTVDEFLSLDYSAGYTECISRHGIVGVGHTSMGGLTERCGDVP
jgi:hypothetical protein